jgi:FMN phosphatase YigB (HAD superfamily)
MKLALFDFDNTLFKTPYDEDPDYMEMELQTNT